MAALYAHNGGQQRVKRVYVHNGAQRTILKAFGYNGGSQESYRYTELEGTLTRGSKSQGTTTVTTTRGYRASNACGSWSLTFGESITGFYATQTTGATTYPRRTFLTTTSDAQLPVAGSTIRASVDGGATWVTMTWVTTDPASGAAFNAYYVDTDAFGFYAMTTDQVCDVRVQYAA